MNFLLEQLLYLDQVIVLKNLQFMQSVPEKEEKTKLFLFEAMFILVVGLIVAGAFYFDEIMSYLSK